MNKRKIFLSIILILSIVLSIKLYLYYYREKKYTFSNFEEIVADNNVHIMNIKNENYFLKKVLYFDPKKYENSNNKIKITKNKFNYSSYIISDTDEYMNTYIHHEKFMLKHELPISKDNKKFLKDTFLNNEIEFIEVYPFNDNNILLRQIPKENSCIRKVNCYFINLETKKDTSISNEYYFCNINLKENVAIFLKKDALTNHTIVFDKYGKFMYEF